MAGQFFIKRSLQKTVQKNKSARTSLGLNYVKNIGIIYIVDDLVKHEAVKQFVQQLEADGKKVKVLSYLEKNKENYEFRFDFFTEKDVNFWGNFKSDNIIKFHNERFDYLFNFDLEPNIYIKKVLALSKATCRVGRHIEANEPFFEWMMGAKDGEKMKDFIQNTYRYLKLIRN